MTELAGCVISDRRGRILLLHRQTAQFSHWELPGGKIEAWEEPPAAAVRELKEELGVAVAIRRSLGSDQFTDVSGDYRYHWFLAEIKFGQPTVLEPQKFDQFEYCNLGKMMDSELSGNVKKLKVAVAAGKVNW